MSLLVVGGTGTLGRQIVLQALTKGYPVRCLVRNFRKASFLKEWGAELIYGDLSIPETIPACFQGITAVIDASTSRPSDLDLVQTVDWNGKIALIEAAKAAKIQRFVFCSTQNLDQFSNIPLMKMKQGIEIKLKQSDIPYTIFRLTGFYQGLIEQYAIPILENLPIWVTNENTCVSYIDTQDIAKFCLKSLQLPDTKNKIFYLGGPKGWVSSEIINLCEQLAGQSAKVNVNINKNSSSVSTVNTLDIDITGDGDVAGHEIQLETKGKGNTIVINQSGINDNKVDLHTDGDGGSVNITQSD